MLKAGDLYECADGQTGVVRGTGPDDASPVFRGITSTLTCDWCYLNATHTEYAHAASALESANRKSDRKGGDSK